MLENISNNKKKQVSQQNAAKLTGSNPSLTPEPTKKK
jgi:hypothetical protein